MKLQVELDGRFVGGLLLLLLLLSGFGRWDRRSGSGSGRWHVVHVVAGC